MQSPARDASPVPHRIKDDGEFVHMADTAARRQAAALLDSVITCYDECGCGQIPAISEFREARDRLMRQVVQADPMHSPLRGWFQSQRSGRDVEESGPPARPD